MSGKQLRRLREGTGGDGSRAPGTGRRRGAGGCGAGRELPGPSELAKGSREVVGGRRNAGMWWDEGKGER